MKFSEAAYWVAQEDELRGAAARRSREILQAVADGIDVAAMNVRWDDPEPGCLWISNDEAGALLSVGDDGEIYIQRHDGAFQSVEFRTVESVMKCLVRTL